MRCQEPQTWPRAIEHALAAKALCGQAYSLFACHEAMPFEERVDRDVVSNELGMLPDKRDKLPMESCVALNARKFLKHWQRKAPGPAIKSGFPLHQRHAFVKPSAQCMHEGAGCMSYTAQALLYASWILQLMLHLSDFYARLHPYL